MSESQSGQPSEAPASPSGASLLTGTGTDAGDQTRAETAPFELSQEPVTPAGEETAGDNPAPSAPAYEHLGELPGSYGTQSVYLVAYDPKQLFAYWDVDWTGGPNTPYALHVCRADGSLEEKIDITAAEAGKYLPVQNPGGTYFVELGKYGRDGRWNVLATSTNVMVPPAGLAGETEPKFATLPFHLSFQRLMEIMHGAVGQGEDLTEALARLQHGDHAGLSALANTLTQLGPGSLHTLETLLGQKLNVDSAGNSSSPPGGSEAHHLHRDRHDVLAAGAFASESLSSADLSSGRGFGPSSETGAFVAGLGGGSETLSSGGFSSGILGELGSSEMLTAYVAGLSSESLTSFAAGPNSEAWRMSMDSTGSGGGSGPNPNERTSSFLKALEHHLGMLGGLFSALSSEPGSSSKW